MTDDEAERLFTAATKMADVMGIEFPDDGVVPLEDPRLEAVEHVCHELAHALLLGIPVIRKHTVLSDRIEVALRELDGEAAECNEALCFVVERAVLPELGIEVEEAALYDALLVQVRSAEAESLFTDSDVSEEAADAIRRIPMIFNTYLEK